MGTEGQQSNCCTVCVVLKGCISFMDSAALHCSPLYKLCPRSLGNDYCYSFKRFFIEWRDNSSLNKWGCISYSTVYFWQQIWIWLYVFIPRTVLFVGHQCPTSSVLLFLFSVQWTIAHRTVNAPSLIQLNCAFSKLWTRSSFRPHITVLFAAVLGLLLFLVFHYWYAVSFTWDYIFYLSYLVTYEERD